MNRIVLVLIAVSCYTAGIAQKLNKIITAKEVTRIESTLSSDAMEGRRTFSAGIDKAANFIAEEFKKAGLKPGGNNGSYLQQFSMFQSTVAGGKVMVNNQELPLQQVICQSTDKQVSIDPSNKNFEITSIKAGENFMGIYRSLRGKQTSQLVFIDTSFRQIFNRLKNFNGPRFESKTTQVYVLTPNANPDSYSIDISMNIEEKKLANVVAVIPGKSKPDEVVIFSGHYDHLGYGRPNDKGDSLYNGANDDASGTTAMIMLAKYFKAIKNNERTLVFAAFTAEEVGGFGAQYFSKQYDANKVIAMFNIEMIGTESKWGKNSAYITGYEKTNMGEILARNLEGTTFKFYPDPYPKEDLFYRSDNATLARLGVPAHTLSTSKMDNEPHYHKASDEIGTLDMQNMAEVIKAIALSSRSIVNGTDAPSRVKTEDLR